MWLVDAVFARIKELMKEKGMSMYRLAMNGGVPRSTIATIPLSETVTLATIYGVCEGFQITLQEFFNSPLFDKDKVTD